MHDQTYPWHRITAVPNKSGIYAWYYRPKLTDFDINELKAEIKRASSNESIGLVSTFLKQHIFDRFAEDPYEAKVWGPLRPTFQGQLTNHIEVTPALSQRIANNPDRLWTLKEVIEKAAPMFASPIYIGMAKNLNERISTHKALIEKYRKANIESPPEVIPTESEDYLPHKFACSVIRRRFQPDGLEVVVKLIETNEDEFVDAENILNRINFPICGRN